MPGVPKPGREELQGTGIGFLPSLIQVRLWEAHLLDVGGKWATRADAAGCTGFSPHTQSLPG